MPLQPVGDLADLLLVLVDRVEQGELPLRILAAMDLHAAEHIDSRFPVRCSRFRHDLCHLSLLTPARGRPDWCSAPGLDGQFLRGR